MLTKINIAIVDDEVAVLNHLVKLFSNISEVSLKCMTTNANELIEKLNTINIDVVLLDINIPEIDGFQLADYLRSNHPSIKIIFMSAYHEYALKGYNFYPEDYLVKPVNFLRLKQTINRITNQSNSIVNNKIGIRSDGVFKLINVNEIKYVERKGRKTRIYLENNQIINCNENLNVLEQMLATKGFYRTHQSFLVQLDKIQEISPDNYMKSYNIKLKDCETNINVSRNKYKELKQELEKFLLS
ncbi:response regulator transcription factor [Bacillus aquiflavi]|uniref:Response regulator transcription factor n=1 Tax=Bacillus aquiflavi TaxID=2672567 RepID=A0A6B3W1F8_9BACI|nr:LytTR family DNA-binding domain-containing protein [Bacillus aquiflavi]MBA4538702.1 response regulator transcription factor [Bacillus aquiflavi]NEY83062.1 response regulator transcription factor [Bacillus aquiflavi]UAC48035.1 LytTR family DNA-binding domain-containing protein [Bacillus aquiflavi]